jgi:hypothetical protein
MKLVNELSKLIGAFAWLIGIILLAVEPAIGFGVLVFALLFSVRSVQKTRERRHQEMLDATRQKPGQ